MICLSSLLNILIQIAIGLLKAIEMKVIISMSGMSSRFANAGYKEPKFMIDVDGKKVIEHIVDLYPVDSDFVFIINDDCAKNPHIPAYLESLNIDKLTLCSVPVHKKGPVFSISEFEHHIQQQ